MFVVNTTSATLGASLPRRLPRKRVPSSRRRNPGFPRRLVTGNYGFLVAGVFDGGGGVPPVAGAVVVGDGAEVAGVAGARPGTADVGALAGAFAGAGALAGGGANVWSRTDFGARDRVDARARRNDSPRNSPPHHQLAFVRRLPV